MEFQQLKTFLTIVNVGSFTKAADVLGYAQSSVSGQIRSLEDDFGVKLFERLGKEVALTEEGKQLVIYADQLLKIAEEAKDTIAGKMTPKGTLVIGTPESLSTFRLPAILQAYRNSFPQVKLVIKLGSCQDIYGWLKKSLIDIAFLLDRPINAPGLCAEILTHEPVTLVASPHHPLAFLERCMPSDLVGEDFLLTDEDSCCYRSCFELQLAEAGVQPEVIQEFGSIETIKRCVMSGLGITILPAIAVEQEIMDGKLKDLHWDCSEFNLFTQMVYRKGKWLTPALTALIQTASDIYRS